MAVGPIKDRLYCKSCEHMDEVPDETVDLVITSPPYWNAIDYEQHVEDPSAWYRTRRGGPYEEYLAWLEVCFSEVKRTLKPGGFCAVVIGTVLFEGRHYPVPHHFATAMTDRLGYLFHDEIVWHKVTGGVKRAGVTIQKPFPGYYYPNIMCESILIFRKPGPPIYRGRAEHEKRAAAFEIDDLFKREIANNVWHIAPVPPNHLPHPCPFPEEIPYRLIRMFSYPGDLVLDPFVGIGTTPKVAKALGRHYIGYDIHAAYLEVARKRIEEPLHLRKQLVAVFEKVPVTDRDYLASQVNSRQLSLPLVAVKEERALYQTGNVERADYEQIRRNFPWVSEPGRLMVTSLDLDGLISAMLMHSLLGWRLVGFYDAQRLWIEKGVDFLTGDVVFLDHDIYRRRVPSIGHHILQYSLDTSIPEHAQSLNPNLLRGVTQKSFGQKYPFGTVHFLLGCLSAWFPGEQAQLTDLPREFLPVLLQVDSSLQSAFTYQRNALEWLEWLGGSDKESPLYPLCRTLVATSPRRLLEWGAQFDDEMRRLGFASSTYSKRRPQAQRVDPTDPADWERLERLLDWLSRISPWHLEVVNFPQLREEGGISIIEMQRGRTRPNKGALEDLLIRRPFSYAIISKGDQGLNYCFLPQRIE